MSLSQIPLIPRADYAGLADYDVHLGWNEGTVARVRNPLQTPLPQGVAVILLVHIWEITGGASDDVEVSLPELTPPVLDAYQIDDGTIQYGIADTASIKAIGFGLQAPNGPQVHDFIELPCPAEMTVRLSPAASGIHEISMSLIFLTHPHIFGA